MELAPCAGVWEHGASSMLWGLGAWGWPHALGSGSMGPAPCALGSVGMGLAPWHVQPYYRTPLQSWGSCTRLPPCPRLPAAGGWRVLGLLSCFSEAFRDAAHQEGDRAPGLYLRGRAGKISVHNIASVAAGAGPASPAASVLPASEPSAAKWSVSGRWVLNCPWPFTTHSQGGF